MWPKLSPPQWATDSMTIWRKEEQLAKKSLDSETGRAAERQSLSCTGAQELIYVCRSKKSSPSSWTSKRHSIQCCMGPCYERSPLIDLDCKQNKSILILTRAIIIHGKENRKINPARVSSKGPLAFMITCKSITPRINKKTMEYGQWTLSDI